jgi:hypothetical protein
VGKHLREDFELAQMGPRAAQNRDRFLTSGGRVGFAPKSGVDDRPTAARRRLADTMTDQGPGLSDVLMWSCCYVQRIEAAEKRLVWSARSGKILLRIALTRLHQHFERTLGSAVRGMIG